MSAPGGLTVRERALVGARERVQLGLLEASAVARAQGMAAVEAEGQLIRPLIAYAAARALDTDLLCRRFWSGALAVQMAHEASLLHDDIIDGAATRRGRPTVAAATGVARALVQGDHLLTSAYRLAAATDSLPFVAAFTRSVERTVAGEIEQAASTGRVMDEATYEAVALGKAGELLGCALVLAPLLSGRGDPEEYLELGRRIGLLYQRLDDLLDYCPAAATGKPPLADFAQRRWTWPLGEIDSYPPGDLLDLPVGEVLALLRAPAPGGVSPLAQCLRRIEADCTTLIRDLRRLLPGDEILESLVLEWVAGGRTAVGRELGAGEVRSGTASPRVSGSLGDRVPTPAQAIRYLSANSRSFRFASRLLPSVERERIARVYAYCRVTDDLVDGPGESGSAEVLLGEWERLSRAAYGGSSTGIELLDTVMFEMRGAGVPFEYAAELIEGMKMDLRGTRYRSLSELRTYTYRVASVVGLWLTRLSGVHDPGVLADAARLGHAMQMTNILRDVGEDWRSGRLYLPLDRMNAHGLSESDLEAMARGVQPIGAAYRGTIEELLAGAEAEYAIAFAAIPALPVYFQRPVAIAAHVYRGIHSAIRRNGYDNFGLRAHTSAPEKTMLAILSLRDLARARRAFARCAPAGARPERALAGLSGAPGA
jgi:15-cis-phytoene synthase